MAKLTAAAANVRATALGGLRTGLSGMLDTTPSPVTQTIGGGSALTFDKAFGPRYTLDGPYAGQKPTTVRKLTTRRKRATK